jgi:tetratricopeptide (TPR) repeat protein
LEFQDEIRIKHVLQVSNEMSDKEDRRKTLIRFGMWLAIGVVVIGGLLTVVFFSMNRYQTRVNAVRETQQAQIQYQTLNTKLENAQDLLRSGRPADAMEFLEEIEAEDPEFPGLEEAVAQAEKLIDLATRYQEATQYLDDGMLEEALSAFQKIEEIEPSYRDTRIRISQAEEALEIIQLKADIETSYEQQDWQAVVDASERIMELDSATDLSGLDDKLFTAYMNLIVATADRIDATIEDIDRAQEYYRAALALFPQSREYAREREELQSLATRLIANNYYIFAMDLLKTEGYGPGTMYEVLRLLNKANTTSEGSPAIDLEIRRGTLFVNGFDKLAAGELDGGIEDLELLYRQDPDYGEGLVQYLLFEAYMSRGDLLFTYGEYDNARADYELAETFAWGDNSNNLRLFEIEIRIGYTLRRLGQLEEAAEYYNYALNLVDFRDRVRRLGEVSQIEEFEAALVAFANKDEWNAARLFETVLEDYSVIYTYEETEVKRGQSLYMLAFESGSTVGAIREENDLGIITSFKFDQVLQLPLFVEADE